MLNKLKELKAGGTSLDGKKLTVTGDLPPCPSCHTAMTKFAKDNNMELVYKWPSATAPPNNVNSVTYKGGDKPAFNGTEAKAMAPGYDLKPGANTGTTSDFSNPQGSQEAYDAGKDAAKPPLKAKNDQIQKEQAAAREAETKRRQEESAARRAEQEKNRKK